MLKVVKLSNISQENHKFVEQNFIFFFFFLNVETHFCLKDKKNDDDVLIKS